MPATTPRGYPYPLPTEPVAEGAQRIRELAEAIDSKSAMDLISVVTLSAAGPLAFSSIPAIYRDLQVRIMARSSAGSNFDTLNMLINGSTAGIYHTQILQGYQATASASEVLSATAAPIGAVPAPPFTTVMGLIVLDILDYAGSQYKSWKSDGTSSGTPGGGGYRFMRGGYWGNAAAVTALTFNGTGNLVAGSRAALYGIR